MAEIRTEITLDSPIDRIWQLLSDHALYKEWNSLFQKATGGLSTGEQLELVVHLPTMSPFIITPKVVMVKPLSGFCWQHKLYSAWLFNWKYCSELVLLAPDRLKFIQRSVFGGILGPLFNIGMKTSVAEGLGKLNLATHRWGEKGNIQCLRC